MKKILVIFDCFGVLCNKVCSEYFKANAKREDIPDIYKEIMDPGELGNISRAEIFRRISKRLAIPEETVRRDIDALFVAHNDLFHLIEKIRGFADVALLSNAYEGHAETAIERFELAPLFDRIFLSWQHGMMKPNLEFYKYCVKSFEKEYEEIYMVDDTDENLDHLSAIGIIPIKYVSAESVSAALKEYLA